ncbi:hypothetical protein GCM10023319_56680 [Nocardia iowensis]
MTGEGNVLAREPADEDVDGFHVAPADLGDVAKVGYLRPVVREYPAGGGVVVAVPYQS